MSAPKSVRPNTVNGFPSETTLDACPSSVRSELHSFYSLLQGWLGIDHKSNGQHADVVADSVSSVDGFTEFGRDDVLGVAVDVPWSPSNFSASGAMTWAPTSAQAYVQACRIGNLMYLSGEVALTNVGGVASTELLVLIPFIEQNNGVINNFVGASVIAIGTLFYIDAGVVSPMGFCASLKDSPYISLRKADGTAWTITAGNDTTVNFSILCPIKQNPL